ncbi:MAG: branched-chain amino acid ABC transporter permease, partial [Candidatus Thorarchaeota archaeon]
AHGAFYIITTYIYYWFYANVTEFLSIPGIVWGIIIGLVVVVGIGALVYFGLIEPLKKSHVGVVIVTFAFAFFIEQFVSISVDSIYHDMPNLIPGSFNFFGVNLYYHYILIIICSFGLIGLITFIINKFKIGKSIRAVAQDPDAAELMGINVNKILAYAVMISAFLAGVAAILYVPVDIVAPHIGWTVLMNSFSIVILGGLGSLPGSVLGSLIISYANAFTNFVLNMPEFSALIPIIVIVLVLIIRPRGLFGKKEID